MELDKALGDHPGVLVRLDADEDRNRLARLLLDQSTALENLVGGLALTEGQKGKRVRLGNSRTKS